ncbi:MAG: hypothetical protein IPK90_04335 [Chitinophagaceae bacterium]|nr:hypothetical protein [Chitinophagaceae bacterium]
MRKLVVMLSAITVSIISCQKEIDWGLATPANLLLVKINSHTGTDSSLVEYFYDAAKRLVREKTTGISGGQSLNSELVINRNVSGVILTTVQKADALVATGIDSILTKYNYNTATSRYTSSIFDLPIPGFAVTDSTVYTYDAAGKIITDAHYLKITGLPIPLPPVLSLKNNYTYSASGSNLEMQQQDAATTPGGPLSPFSTQTYTFDLKVNPLKNPTEAVLLIRSSLYNANNIAKTVVTNTASPANDYTMDYTYKYNTAGKPDSSYGTRTPGGAITGTKYFYQ